jgi:hypothetical protein
MGERYAGRFVLEAAFLGLLAVGVGLAGVRTAAIVAVMVGGWLVVALIELLAWRAARPAPRYVPEQEPQPLPELHGWDVAEIIAPQAEPEPAELTSIFPVEDEPPKRRWFRRGPG